MLTNLGHFHPVFFPFRTGRQGPQTLPGGFHALEPLGGWGSGLGDAATSFYCRPAALCGACRGGEMERAVDSMGWYFLISPKEDMNYMVNLVNIAITVFIYGIFL